VEEIGRLYEAGLARQFDVGGLNFLMDQEESGMPLITMAANFLDSSEFAFRGRTFNLSSNVPECFGSDSGGGDYWLNAMSNGFSQRGVLLAFWTAPGLPEAPTLEKAEP
jgi:hypothetical protein